MEILYVFSIIGFTLKARNYFSTNNQNFIPLFVISSIAYISYFLYFFSAGKYFVILAQFTGLILLFLELFKIYKKQQSLTETFNPAMGFLITGSLVAYAQTFGGYVYGHDQYIITNMVKYLSIMNRYWDFNNRLDESVSSLYAPGIALIQVFFQGFKFKDSSASYAIYTFLLLCFYPIFDLVFPKYQNLKDWKKLIFFFMSMLFIVAAFGEGMTNLRVDTITACLFGIMLFYIYTKDITIQNSLVLGIVLSLGALIKGTALAFGAGGMIIWTIKLFFKRKTEWKKLIKAPMLSFLCLFLCTVSWIIYKKNADLDKFKNSPSTESLISRFLKMDESREFVLKHFKNEVFETNLNREVDPGNGFIMTKFSLSKYSSSFGGTVYWTILFALIAFLLSLKNKEKFNRFFYISTFLIGPFLYLGLLIIFWTTVCKNHNFAIDALFCYSRYVRTFYGALAILVLGLYFLEHKKLAKVTQYTLPIILVFHWIFSFPSIGTSIKPVKKLAQNSNLEVRKKIEQDIAYPDLINSKKQLDIFFTFSPIGTGVNAEEQVMAIYSLIPHRTHFMDINTYSTKKEFSSEEDALEYLKKFDYLLLRNVEQLFQKRFKNIFNTDSKVLYKFDGQKFIGLR
ncbi:MAG: hypothetical protein H6622_12725 [Halobacteriovoraceae bacterium]|nr:hypothetical protein [Halobacteriovoraceae bacterium]